MPLASRIVPTGPESFVEEQLRIDRDFFGCCDDCQDPEHHHPIDESDEADELRPVLVVSR